MGILKCLSWFEMSTNIKDCVSFESFPFVDVGVQECCFLIGNFSRKFDRRVMIVCLFNEMFYSVSVCSPEREDVVYVTFPNERFKKANKRKERRKVRRQKRSTITIEANKKHIKKPLKQRIYKPYLICSSVQNFFIYRF